MHFSDVPGQHRLLPEAAAKYAQAFEAALGERVGGHLLRDVLWLQARAVRTAVQQQGPLWIFRWQPRASDPGSMRASGPDRLLWMAEEGDAWAEAEEAAHSPRRVDDR